MEVNDQQQRTNFVSNLSQQIDAYILDVMVKIRRCLHWKSDTLEELTLKMINCISNTVNKSNLLLILNWTTK